MQCKHCRKYEKLGRVCTMDTVGECDCPKCQGFCRCRDFLAKERDEWEKEMACYREFLFQM